MRLRSSRAGKLLSFGSMLLWVSSASSALDAERLPARVGFVVLAVLSLISALRLETAGVFDRDGSIVVKRVWGRQVTIPTAASPVAEFEQYRLGYQLIIRADGLLPVSTGFVFARSALEPRLEFPSDLALRRSPAVAA